MRLRDVAEAAGVSTATASLVLNEKAASISNATQSRVIDAAEALGYRPNALARGLRSNRSGTIGFISRDIVTTPYAGALIHGAQQIADKNGNTLLLANTPGDPASEHIAAQTLIDRRIDAAIFATMYHQVVELPAELRSVPCVILNSRAAADADVSWVAPDERGGATAAVETLIRAGHRRVAYIDSHDEPPASAERRAAYLDLMADAGLSGHARVVTPMGSDDDPAGGARAQRAIAELLAADDRPTALFCFNDRTAAGAYIAARRAGLSIPQDLSIVGFDNQVLVADSIDPGLTTVQLPHEAMGRWAMEQLLRQLDGEHGARTMRMPCPLVERGSVAPPG